MNLVEKAGLSVSYVSMIENGRRRVNLDALIRIANILGVTVDALLNMGINCIIRQNIIQIWTCS